MTPTKCLQDMNEKELEEFLLKAGLLKKDEKEDKEMSEEEMFKLLKMEKEILS